MAKEVKKEQAQKEKKVFKFMCLYQKALFVPQYNLWFKDGYLEVEDEEIANYIRTLYGVEEVK